MRPRPATTALLLTLSLAMLAVLPAGGAARTSRPFAEKVADLRYPLAAAERPSPLKRAILPKQVLAIEPGAGQRSDRLVIKFIEGMPVRLRGGKLVSVDGRALPGVDEALALPGVLGVERLFSRSEAHLDRDRAYASARAGVALADLNNYYLVWLDESADRGAVAASWLALEVIETAYFEGIATEACTDIPPVTPSFIANQTYLDPAPAGVDAREAWAFDPAGRGVPDFWLIDVERGWNVNHEDFGDVAILNGQPYGPSIDHGTAVLGEIVSCEGDYGVTGIANGITARMVNWQNESSIAAAFDLAASYLDPGEIYLIEIHMQGPPSGQVCQCNCGQFEYVPMEWDQANFDAIQMHTAAGVIVVEAGGNGSMDLDGPQYGGAFNRSIRDSGAILVGAGTPGDHAPECWTNHGSRIDCQGFGSSVASTGYGGLFNPGDTNQLYTATFSGTSSATPIVTGVAAVAQNLAQQVYGVTLDPISLRALVSLFGTPQGEPLAKHIGVLPDLKQMIDEFYRVVITHTPLPDTTNETDPYPVVATIVPAVLSGTIQAATVHYSVSGGSYHEVAMSPTGNPDEWQGEIPAQVGGNYLRYYLTVDPEFGPDVSFPAGGAGDPLLFIVGIMIPIASDNLETPGEWTIGAPDDDATSGIWERGDPHGTYLASRLVAPEDDHTPDPGVIAFVTGNPGPGAQPWEGDVDGGKTTLISPGLDLSSQIYLRISAAVWIRLPGDDVLSIDVSSDAGQSWQPLAVESTDLEEWQLVEVELTHEDLALTDRMMLRFVASDYGTETFVECGVDDLVIRGLVQPTQGLAAGTRASLAPAALRLGPATPNPFRPATRLVLSLPAAGTVRLLVYDVDGRLVRSLLDGPAEAGARDVVWDGTNEAGERMAPGVYWFRLEAGGRAEASRVVMLR